MKESKSNKKVMSFTLVLGGGGARGFAHIGVLKALEKLELIPKLIVGTSMGAVIGGMYAQLRSADKVERKVREFLKTDFFKKIGLEQFSDIDNNNSGSVWERFSAHLRQRYLFSKSVLGSGIFAQSTLIQSLKMLLEDSNIEDTGLKFAAVTSDLVSGEEHVVTSGSIITAVAASSAVPGIIAPIPKDNHLFIDGTVTSTIPVPAASLLSKKKIVAVDVRHALGGFENHRHGYEVVMRASEVTTRKLNDLHLKKANLVLKPNVYKIDWNEFARIDECINAGERSVEENEQLLMKKLVKHPFLFFHW